jgi:PPK2 family polyphosphate:nucleotide phosphotransferase
MPYAHRIDGRRKVRLGKYDPSDTRGLSRDEALAKTAKLAAEMSDLHDLLFEAGDTGLLLVLQGRDAAGKDGTIRHVLQTVNVQSARVVPFKVPTAKEAGHDFLWRVHSQTPGRGEVVLFNRSHYEDVLVVRVHDLVPREVWKRRYDHINAFEAMLTDADTIVLKFYLHISKSEQKRRFLDREHDTEKAWKLSVGDWKEREHWDEYTKAYEEALSRCASDEAPWYIVPADKKWYRDLAVTEAIVQALRPYRSRWLERLGRIGDHAKQELAAYRKEGR